MKNIRTELDNEIRRGRSHEPISVFLHCSPLARQSRPINGILVFAINTIR
jgi:hypothetical protein